MLFHGLAMSRSAGGTRVRIDLSAEEVSSILGSGLQEARCGTICHRLEQAAAELLARMAKAVADIMQFTSGELQLCWAMDLRGVENGIARNYIGIATCQKIVSISAYKATPSLEMFLSSFRSLSGSREEPTSFNQEREWWATLKSWAPKGMFLKESEPFVTCHAALCNCPMIDLDWGAGKPIGVMSANSGCFAMCEVQPAQAGGVSLYINLTSISWTQSFLAQGTPTDWVQRVQGCEFRENLIKPFELQARRSKLSQVHPDAEMRG